MGKTVYLGTTALVLEHMVASGGEGAIWTVSGRPQQVAKIYHQPHEAMREKVMAMIAYQPRDPGQVGRATTLAWPQNILLERAGGRFVGFLMPSIDRTRYVTLFRVLVPEKREQLSAPVSRRVLLRIAANLAGVVAALHQRGYILGDVLNESNVLCDIDTGLVCLVDCDSLQVPREEGGVFVNAFKKTDYLAPELQGMDLHTATRTVLHDRFSLAVLLFLLLMEGWHPHDGVGGPEVPLEDSIAHGAYAYEGGSRTKPPPGSVPLEVLEPGVRNLFHAAFVDGHKTPSLRPHAATWREVLLKGERALIACPHNHLYSSHLHACPWCERDPMRNSMPVSSNAASRFPTPPSRMHATQRVPYPGQHAKPSPLPLATQRQHLGVGMPLVVVLAVLGLPSLAIVGTVGAAYFEAVLKALLHLN